MESNRGLKKDQNLQIFEEFTRKALRKTDIQYVHIWFYAWSFEWSEEKIYCKNLAQNKNVTMTSRLAHWTHTPSRNNCFSWSHFCS